jgi:hypothetical protein
VVPDKAGAATREELAMVVIWPLPPTKLELPVDDPEELPELHAARTSDSTAAPESAEARRSERPLGARVRLM